MRLELFCSIMIDRLEEECIRLRSFDLIEQNRKETNNDDQHAIFID